MELVNSFHGLLQVFVLAMTEPTSITFRTLVIGWVFASRRTELGTVRCSRTTRHHAAFHRVVAAANWNRKYRSKTTDLMIEMLDCLDKHAADQSLHFLGDLALTAHAVLARIQRR